MSDLVRELVLAAEALDAACDSADPREFFAARARLRAVLPKITTEDDPDPPPDHTEGGEERERCPDCGHPHLPMPRPHRLPSGLLVDPVCDWPMGPESCACRRRATPRPR